MDVRRGLAFAGLGALIAGIVLFVVAEVETSQQAIAFANCYGGMPPFGGYPTTCTDALNAMALWQGLSLIAAVVGVLGLILLVLGLVLQPEGVFAGPPYAPQYPPPVYAPSYPPPVYPPPQEPRNPPPGNP